MVHESLEIRFDYCISLTRSYLYLTHQISNLYTPVMPLGNNSDIHLKRPVLTAGKPIHRLRCRSLVANWSPFRYWSSLFLNRTRICRNQLGLQCIWFLRFRRNHIRLPHGTSGMRYAGVARCRLTGAAAWFGCGELVCLANGKHEWQMALGIGLPG